MPDPRDQEPRGLHAYLSHQALALREADATLRRGNSEGVHELRVASRRIRAALDTFEPAFDTAVSEPLREELGWLARSLGPARDLHVVRERLRVLTEAERADDGADTGVLPEVLRLEDWARRDEASVLELLESPRYQHVLSAVDAFAAQPPWTPRGRKDPRRFVRRRIRKEWKALARRVDAVTELELGAAPDEQLHDVRRAARRVRYALEVAELVWPGKPKRLRKRVRHLTDVLGERQDTAVTRAVLRELAAEAEVLGDPGLVLERLAHLDRIEASRGVALEAEFQHAWSAAVRRRRTWP